MRSVFAGIALSLLFAAFGTGCDGNGTGTGGAGGGSGGNGGSGGGDGGSGGGGSTQSISLQFAGFVGSEAFDCSTTFAGLGTGASEAKITDFRLYVHDLALHASDGTWVPVELTQDGVWQYETLALLDFESGSGSCANGTPELHTSIAGTVPKGDYDGVRFKMGVPFELNHGDVATAPSPLNLSALFWNWNGGYKFLRVDAVATGAPMSFNLHLGSTECQDDGSGGVSSCNKPNRPEIELIGKDPLTTKIAVDYGAVIADSDISKDGGGGPGCMSGPADPECAGIFDKLGLDIDTGAPTPGQVLFHFE